jgi:CRP-like cAMP-binding protein
VVKVAPRTCLDNTGKCVPRREGEEADNFYVIESGTFAATKAAGGESGGADGSVEWVATYEGHGAFGELALMYNCPRAATVTGPSQRRRVALTATDLRAFRPFAPLCPYHEPVACLGLHYHVAMLHQLHNSPFCWPSPSPGCLAAAALTEGVLWGVDRATFRSLVVHSMEERRRRHEAALRRVPLLQHLTPSQLAAVADCLHQETFEVCLTGCGLGNKGEGTGCLAWMETQAEGGTAAKAPAVAPSQPPD